MSNGDPRWVAQEELGEQFLSIHLDSLWKDYGANHSDRPLLMARCLSISPQHVLMKWVRAGEQMQPLGFHIPPGPLAARRQPHCRLQVSLAPEVASWKHLPFGEPSAVDVRLCLCLYL